MKKISALPNSNADGVGGFDYGSVKDASAPGLYDGTPFRADWQNDIQAFFQRMLTEAGVVPDGASDTPATSQLYEAFIGSIRPNWTSAFSVGSAAAFSAGVSSVTALSGTDIAYCDDNAAGHLRAYRFNGSTFAQVGSALTIAGTTYPAITAMSATDVAFIDSVNDSLRCYRFNGSTWSLVGSGLSVANSAVQRGLSLTALNATDVAYCCADGTDIRLRCYRFNGSTWSLVGSELVITGAAQQVALAALNATDVAFIDSANDSLRCYRFSGSTWSLVGSGLSVSGNVPYLTSLNATDVALIDNGRTLGTYRFDGSTFALVGSPVKIAGGAGQPAIAAMGGGYIAYSYDGLQCYEIGHYYGNHIPYRPF